MNSFLHTLLYPVLFFLLGPVMALAPRQMLIWIVVLALSFLPVFFQERKAICACFSRPICLTIIAAFLFTGASLLWSPSLRSLEMFCSLAGMSLAGGIFILAQSRLPQTVRANLSYYYAAGWMAGLALLVMEITFDFPVFRFFNHMPAGGDVNENVAKRAAALFALGVWPFAFTIQQSGKRGLAILALVLFTALCLYLGSRSALFGCVLGLVIFALAHFHEKLARLSLSLTLAFCVALTPVLFSLLPLAPPALTDRFFSSAQHRMKIWALTAEHVKTAPLFGNGLDSSRGIESRVTTQATSYMPEGVHIISLHPHNLFLQIWLDGGLTGALLWGGLLVLLARRIRHLPIANQPYVLGAFFTSLAMLSTTYSLLQAWWLAGHMAVAGLLLMQVHKTDESAATSGTSAGGME